MHNVNYTLEDIAKAAGITDIKEQDGFNAFESIEATTDDLEIVMLAERGWREDGKPGFISDLLVYTLNKQTHTVVQAKVTVFLLPLEEVARRLKIIINTQDQLQGE